MPTILELPLYRFDIEDMGIAHWYLQGRLLQHEDHSISLDQSRYMALIAAHFLPQHDNTNITKEEKEKYSSPLPTTFVASKKDGSKDLVDIQTLEDEFGFQYSSAIGMLVFLLNTATALHFAIRKLTRFNTLPGKKH